jgi:hypothetical protein
MKITKMEARRLSDNLTNAAKMTIESLAKEPGYWLREHTQDLRRALQRLERSIVLRKFAERKRPARRKSR